MNANLILKAVCALRAGRVSDAGVYKAAVFSAPAYPDVAINIRRLANPFPQIDPYRLRTLSTGTFGHAYVSFLAANGLKPLDVSPVVGAEIARINPLAVRYPILHEAFHVLLGFDASLPGELGVWSFVSAQRYSPSFDRAATFARFLYPPIAPASHQQLREERRRSMALALEVPSLIAKPMEEYWHEPLATLRHRLNITVPPAVDDPINATHIQSGLLS